MIEHMKDLLDLILHPSKRKMERDKTEAVVEAKFQTQVAASMGSLLFKNALSTKYDWRIKPQ